MFQVKFVENFKTHILCSIFFRESCCLLDNVGKYRISKQAVDDNLIRCRKMRFAYWITKARMQACSHIIWYLLFSPDNSGHATRLIVTFYIHCLSCLEGISVFLLRQKIWSQSMYDHSPNLCVWNTFYNCPLILYLRWNWMSQDILWVTYWIWISAGNGLAWRILLPTVTPHELRLNNKIKLSAAYYNRLISRLWLRTALLQTSRFSFTC